MASQLDVSLAAAEVYAESLLELANERGVTDDLFAEFESLVQYIREDEGFAGFMASSAVDDDDRRESLRRIFEGRLSELLLNTLLVLNDHNRAGIVPLVFEKFKDLVDAQKNRQDVYVRSAVELSDDQREMIRGSIAEMTGKEIVLIEEVEPSLLGGVVVKVNDTQLDGSLRNKLLQMREFMFEKGRQEILSGRHSFWVE